MGRGKAGVRQENEPPKVGSRCLLLASQERQTARVSGCSNFPRESKNPDVFWYVS